MKMLRVSNAFQDYIPILTEFEERTVSYGPSSFQLIYGPSARAIIQREKTRIRNLQYGPRKTRLVRYLLCL